MRGHTEILERLLRQKDACTEVRDSMQETPLMLAACYHNSAAVRVLLQAGANSRAVDWRGKDALAYASKSASKAKKDDYDVVVKLLSQAMEHTSAQQQSSPKVVELSPPMQPKSSPTQSNSTSTAAVAAQRTSPLPPATSGALSASTRNVTTTHQHHHHHNSSINNDHHHHGHHHGHHGQLVAKKTGRGGESEEVLKAKGNQAFGCENYAKAIDLYTQAIQINETNHVLYSNRAACYLALGQPMFAKVDAIKCVGIDPKFLKGHYRLAEAHIMLHDYERALRDVETGLKIAPEEPSFIDLKKKIEGIIAERDFLPADRPIEGLTQYPQSKYLHPRRDVIFGSGQSGDEQLRVWAGVVHYIDATLWSNCLQLRVLLRNLGEQPLQLSKSIILQWSLLMRNGVTRIKTKQPDHDGDNLADPSHVSIIELNGADISSKQMDSIVLNQGYWAIVSFAFRVPMARYESEALKRSASLSVFLVDNSSSSGTEVKKNVTVTLNQAVIKKYYKGFRPGLICGQPGPGDTGNVYPKWRPDPGLTAAEKKVVVASASTFNDEEYAEGFALKIRDADSKFVVYTYIMVNTLTMAEIKQKAKELLDKEDLKLGVRSLIKNPERCFMRTDEDLKKYGVCDDTEIDVDFQPYPLDDID